MGVTLMKMSKMANGRIAIYNPNHPGANGSGYILYSRYLMEKKIGRELRANENIHHINKNPLDDRIENLELMSRGEHTRLHRKRLDYNLIKFFRNFGMGYKKISNYTGYKRDAIRSALKVMGV